MNYQTNGLQNSRQNLAHLKEIKYYPFFTILCSLHTFAPELTGFPNNLGWQV